MIKKLFRLINQHPLTATATAAALMVASTEFAQQHEDPKPFTPPSEHKITDGKCVLHGHDSRDKKVDLLVHTHYYDQDPNNENAKEIAYSGRMALSIKSDFRDADDNSFTLHEDGESLTTNWQDLTCTHTSDAGTVTYALDLPYHEKTHSPPSMHF